MSWRRESANNYWDIDDILAEEETVHTKFMANSNQKGLLLAANTHDTWINKGQSLDIPLWLAIPLCQGKIIKIEVPKIYSSQFLQTLKADPIIINLREKNYYYYELGYKLQEYLEDDEKEIEQTIKHTFLKRIKEFSRISYHLQIEDCYQLLRKMANVEIAIFNQGRDTAMKIRQWKTKKLDGYQATFQQLKKVKIN